MSEMIICGLSMEMELAKEMGTIGKCIGCRYFEKLRNEKLFCEKYDEILDEEKEDCSGWAVDIR